HDRPCPGGDGAGGQRRPVVQGIDLRTGKPLEETILDHRPGAGQPLLRRLKEQMHAAVEPPRLREVTRRAKQHRRMPVMSAAVGNTGVDAGVWGPGGFLDRQRIHVGAQADRPVGVSRRDHSDDAGPADAFVNVDAPVPHRLRHHGCGAFLFVRQLRMAMQVAAYRAHLPRQLVDAGEEGGRRSWRGFAGAHGVARRGKRGLWHIPNGRRHQGSHGAVPGRGRPVRSLRRAALSQLTGSGGAEGCESGSAISTRLTLGPTQRSTSSIRVKPAGTTISVSAVEVIRPPITAIAIGARNSSPTAMATGSMPATMATVVMTMGRARLWPDSRMAVSRSLPARISSIAKSTSRMAFLATIPISIRKPIMTPSDRGFCVSIRASTAPPRDSGSEERMVSGCSTRTKSSTSTANTISSPVIMAMPKSVKSSLMSCALPVSTSRTPCGR